ncbi:hypothetical protein ACP4OV_010351 [Aristida adscensionis]
MDTQRDLMASCAVRRASAVAGALLLLFVFVAGAAAAATGTEDGSELWGYANVRPKVHLFWWYYKSPQRVSSPAGRAWPTVLWLQGGPGGSGVGRGNFEEIGPLDVNLQPRNFTWLHKADLIFVDSPVGVGYSYADDPSALARTDRQAAADVVALLTAVAREIPGLPSSPLYLVGESYGGKHAAMAGVSLARSIRAAAAAAAVNLTLGGVALGDSWISPDDFALSYAQLLHDVSRMNDNAVGQANRMAQLVKKEMLCGQFAAARQTWTDLLDLIDSRSNGVNMDNFLIDTGMNPILADDLKTKSSSLRSSQSVEPNTIDGIMNGVIKQKLKIIPKDIIWQEASLDVYDALVNSFMRPAINEVDELLSYGVNVTVYNGQLDVICSMIGTEAWVNKLKWGGLKKFLSLRRNPLHYCDSAIYCSKQIKAYFRSYRNLQFYWVLEAGHMVPVDQPYVAFRMIGSVTQSPAT